MVCVERGLKVFRHSRSCSVIGANAGDWLLSFSPKDWEDVKVLGSQSDPWLGLAGRSLRKLSFASTLDLVSAVQECDVVLGAGLIEQLTSLLALFRTTKPVLLVSQGHSARRLVGTKPFRLTHAAAGGVTTWSGKVWTRCWNMGPWPRTVRRDIGHVLIHSDVPRACQPNPSLAHLKPTQLLPLDGSDLPVVFHSYATCANWGYRKLSHKETAHAMDVPVRLVDDSTGLAVWVARHAAGLVFPLKPLQMATQLLLQTLGSVDTVQDDPVQPADEHPSLVTWLPCVQRELSHAWALANAVSAKALKADNAQIATGVWDKRVSLVLPWNHINMAGLRRLVFGRWQRSLRREFHTCMCSAYGSAWLDRVLECRRRGLLLPAQRESSSPRSPQQGGNNGNNRGRLGNNGLSRSSKRANKAISGSEAHLIKDAKIGCEALEHVLDSTWWEWTNGSGLLFWR
jgi:hypothetical protein